MEGRKKIPFGCGKLAVDGQYYDISPNTLYVTGPHVEHAQMPVPFDPMREYCVYLKIRGSLHNQKKSPVIKAFTSMPFWIGTDTQGIHILMKQLFSELEHCYTGCQNQVHLLLSQLLIYTVRNYERHMISQTSFTHNNAADSKSIIIEEYFLYEYQSLSLNVLADRLKLSTRQTQRLLMEYYGKSFQQKKTESRMSAAAILLYFLRILCTSVAIYPLLFVIIAVFQAVVQSVRPFILAFLNKGVLDIALFFIIRRLHLLFPPLPCSLGLYPFCTFSEQNKCNKDPKQMKIDCIICLLQ